MYKSFDQKVCFDKVFNFITYFVNKDWKWFLFFVIGLLQTENQIVDEAIVLVEKALQILFHNQKKRILTEQLTNILDWHLKPGHFLISKLIDWTYNLLGRSNSVHIISVLQQLPNEYQWKRGIDSIVLLHET